MSTGAALVSDGTTFIGKELTTGEALTEVVTGKAVLATDVILLKKEALNTGVSFLADVVLLKNPSTSKDGVMFLDEVGLGQRLQ